MFTRVRRKLENPKILFLRGSKEDKSMILKKPNVKSLAIFSLILFIALSVVSMFLVPGLQTQYSLRQFLPTDNPILQRDEHSRQMFQLPDVQPFIITAKINEGETWFDRDHINDLARLTELLSHFPGVRNTLSLATVQGAISNKSGLTVGPLLKNLPVAQWAEQTLNNPLIAPALVSKDSKTVSIIVNIKVMTTKELTALRQNLQVASAASIPFAKIEMGGTPAVQTDVGVLLHAEVRNFVILGFIATFAVLALIFSNWSPLLISFIIVLCSNLIVLAVFALAGFPFSVLSSTIPILTTVDVVSLIIHSLLRYAEEKKTRPGLTHHELVVFTLKKIWRPNLIASITTLIGFLSLVTVKVPLIKDYGITAAIAIFLGWVVTTGMMLPLLYFLPGPRARVWAWRKARWGLYLFRRSGVWAVLIVVICSALAIKGKNLSWSARLFDDLPTNHQVRLSTETIDRELGGMIPVDLEIKGKAEAWNDPALLARLDKLSQELRSIEGIGSVVGIPDLIAASNLHQSRLPASRASTAEIFFLFSLSSESPLKNFLTSDGTMTRLSMRTNDLPANQLQALVDKSKQLTMEAFPELDVEVTGMGSTIPSLNNQLSHELIFGFWQSMIAIFLVLCIVFRSVRWSLIACIPNLVPPAALLGFLAISETPIKPSVAIIFSIALGLAFNNTVYFLVRLKQFYKNSATKTLEVEKTLWLEGNPCLISSMTLLAGFSVFMASYFAMNRIFGFYMLLSMLAGLVGDLILLPTMLKSCPWLLTPWTFRKGKVMATTSMVLIATLILCLPHSSLAAIPPVGDIGKQMSQRLSAKDEAFSVQMRIVEADGTGKDREMKIWRLSPSKDNHSLLVRMQKPTDLKGTALLASVKGDQEEKWIYLPSTKQTRRLTGESGKGGILGSELSVEDFDFNRDKGTESVVKKEVDVDGKKYWMIESNVASTSANYSKVVSYVSQAEYLPMKVETYDKQGKLLKILEITDYKKLPDNKWRAGKIKIKNVQNKRGTEITLSGIKLNQNLRASLFTPKALGED
jgi:predicted RND superfamily exporter protein/outer membrane lipoprotein-sorting protein